MSARSTYCHAVQQDDSNILRSSWLVRADVNRVKPNHVFWTLTCTRCDVAFSEFEHALTMNDFEAILEYINHHYRIAHRRNKQSGSHSDFENFVGTRYYLFYYHLWLNEDPNLLIFAVAELPSNAFWESYHVSRASDDDNRGIGTNVSEDASSTTCAPRKRRDERRIQSQRRRRWTRTTKTTRRNNLQMLWLHFIRHSLKKQSQIESQQLHVASKICQKCSPSTRDDWRQHGWSWTVQGIKLLRFWWLRHHQLETWDHIVQEETWWYLCFALQKWLEVDEVVGNIMTTSRKRKEVTVMAFKQWNNNAFLIHTDWLKTITSIQFHAACHGLQEDCESVGADQVDQSFQ